MSEISIRYLIFELLFFNCARITRLFPSTYDQPLMYYSVLTGFQAVIGMFLGIKRPKFQFAI